jgi:hypothetical protein
MTTQPPPCPNCSRHEAAFDRLLSLVTEDGYPAIYVSRERILAAIDGGPTAAEAASDDRT